MCTNIPITYFTACEVGKLHAVTDNLFMRVPGIKSKAVTGSDMGHYPQGCQNYILYTYNYILCTYTYYGLVLTYSPNKD